MYTINVIYKFHLLFFFFRFSGCSNAWKIISIWFNEHQQQTIKCYRTWKFNVPIDGKVSVFYRTAQRKQHKKSWTPEKERVKLDFFQRKISLNRERKKGSAYSTNNWNWNCGLECVASVRFLYSIVYLWFIAFQTIFFFVLFFVWGFFLWLFAMSITLISTLNSTMSRRDQWNFKLFGFYKDDVWFFNWMDNHFHPSSSSFSSS